ncbi:jg23775 [Pararge aegeria aegeria]|uniref:Jg23775 protein n=1 Tax=Pararge aegeria aegeria TaxID=348720 RepID=A0A8S4SQ17_9NEOP|nr:jg23775 [Pararge aegeria aegeria]
MTATPSIAGLTNRSLFRIQLQEPYEETILRDETTPNIRSITFSPKGTYLAYRTDKKAEIIKCANWEPKWSSDEKLFAMLLNNRVLIYEDVNLDRYTQYIQAEKLQSFSISPSMAPAYYFSIFTLGTSGQPSFWRVFKYPEFEVTQALVNRSSFQADKAAFHWNRRGTNVFAMTQTEVDKTGGSYYGKQSLSYGDVKGNAGNMSFSK